MKKGQFVKCISISGLGFTVDKIYEVIAGEGDADISITCLDAPIESMDDTSFNIMDDNGDIRFSALGVPFIKWEEVE